MLGLVPTLAQDSCGTGDVGFFQHRLEVAEQARMIAAERHLRLQLRVAARLTRVEHDSQDEGGLGLIGGLERTVQPVTTVPLFCSFFSLDSYDTGCRETTCSPATRSRARLSLVRRESQELIAVEAGALEIDDHLVSTAPRPG
ncbi:MAG: hypothetical protein U1E76_11920 [Planctomycetota bacterium]